MFIDTPLVLLVHDRILNEERQRFPRGKEKWVSGFVVGRVILLFPFVLEEETLSNPNID